MARNMYPGVCYVCGRYIPTGYGHFERHHGKWRVKCVKCASGRVVHPDDREVSIAIKKRKGRDADASKEG